MTNRREFLKQGVVLASGIMVAPHLAFKLKNPKVIILGAGFSGLAAAYKLRQNGITPTILEARNRINGRVFSQPVEADEPLVVEFGAEWVGASHTRIQELCKDFGLELFDNRFNTHLTYRGRYYASGEWDYTEGWKTKFQELLDNYANLTEDDKIVLDQMDWWRYLVNNGISGFDLDVRELLDSTDFGESIRHVSAFAALAEYAESSEKNEMDYKIRGGNAMLGEKLADQIGRENILTGHKVQRIVQSNNKVEIHTSDGKTFEADKVICTLPTYAMSQITWEPGLPEEKAAAMNALQYARINKNALLYSDRFWIDESFDMVTDGPAHYFYHATKNQLETTKGVLISYSIGDKADFIAKQDDNFRSDMVDEALRLGFGKTRNYLVKQASYYWGDDEYSKGAYALYGVGQWFGLMPALKKPFKNVHFAGEHVADWQGFMEGAINTGEEAAENIL